MTGVLKFIRKETDQELLQPEDSIEDLDLDSLEFLELATKLETHFAIELSIDRLALCGTVGDLIYLVEHSAVDMA